MPTALEAFNLAYGIGLVGVYFEGGYMISEIGEGAPDPIAEACKAQMEALAGQAGMTRRHIRAVHKSLETAGLTVPEMPAHTAGYREWSDQIAESYWSAIAEDDFAMAAYMLGWHMGSWIQGANLAAIALVFKDLDGTHPAVGEQLTELKGVLSAAAEGLEEAAGEGLEPVEKAVEIVKGAPPPNDPSQDALDVADDFQEALHDLGELVEQVQEAFTEDVEEE